MNFNEKLRLTCIDKNNRLCIGLDVDNNSLNNNSLDYMNSYIKDIIISTIDICPVYKINFSFYERYANIYIIVNEIVKDGKPHFKKNHIF